MDGFEPQWFCTQWFCEVLISCRFRRYKDLFFFSSFRPASYLSKLVGLGLTILLEWKLDIVLLRWILDLVLL